MLIGAKIAKKSKIIEEEKTENKNSHMLSVLYYLSPVTRHLLPTPTATATDPPHANSSTKHSRLVGWFAKTVIFFFGNHIIHPKTFSPNGPTALG